MLIKPSGLIALAPLHVPSSQPTVPSPPFCVTDKNPLEDQRYCQNGDTGGFRRILHDAIDDVSAPAS
jgi:hypothetical protein